jgi:FkbM family methyltransferase
MGHNFLEVTNKTLVKDFYRVLLEREPESFALASYSKRLDDGESVKSVLSEIFYSSEFQSRLPYLTHLANDGSRIPAINGFSQYGEDQLLIISTLSEALGSGFFVDIGANSRTGSNSWWLASNLSMRGLMVEANPKLASNLKEEVPKSVVVENCAVGSQNGELDFFISENDAVSSLSENWVKGWGAPYRKIRVKVITLRELFEKHNVPKVVFLLTIDIEGQDLEVCNEFLELDDYKAEWIILELASLEKDEIELKVPKLSLSYREAFRTHSNVIYKKIISTNS